MLRDKAANGAVQIGVRGYQRIPESVLKEMEKLGVRVKPSSGVISLNLTANDVTLYYTPQPHGSKSSEERIGIRISGDPGRILSAKIDAIRSEWLSEESSLGSLEIAYREVLEKIQKDPSDLKKLKEMLRNDELEISWRVILMLHLLQTKEEKFYSVSEITKELQCSLENVRGCIFTWYKHKTSSSRCGIYDFDWSEKEHEKLKLFPKAKDLAVPIAFCQILIYLAAGRDKTASEIMTKYNLPPLQKKGINKIFM